MWIIMEIMQLIVIKMFYCAHPYRYFLLNEKNKMYTFAEIWLVGLRLSIDLPLERSSSAALQPH